MKGTRKPAPRPLATEQEPSYAKAFFAAASIGALAGLIGGATVYAFRIGPNWKNALRIALTYFDQPDDFYSLASPPPRRGVEAGQRGVRAFGDGAETQRPRRTRQVTPIADAKAGA